MCVWIYSHKTKWTQKNERKTGLLNKWFYLVAKRICLSIAYHYHQKIGEETGMFHKFLKDLNIKSVSAVNRPDFARGIQMAVSRCAVWSLGSIGIALGLVGFLLSRAILRGISEKTKLSLCTDSYAHSNINKFLGNASDRLATNKFMIRFWNITNKQQFLTEGAIPRVSEVGPFVYRFGQQKLDLEFFIDSFRYKPMTLYEFDPVATKSACPMCSLEEPISLVSLHYIGLMRQFGGDHTFALSMIPVCLDSLLKAADVITGSRENTLTRLGGASGIPLETNVTNWNIEFSAYLRYVNTTSSSDVFGKVLRYDYSSIEMQGLYSVLLNASLLGTSPGSNLAPCLQNPSAVECADKGFMIQARGYVNMFKAGNTSTAEFSVLKLRLEALFCPNLTMKCLAVSSVLIQSILSYVTEHLVKFSIHTLIVATDNDVVTTKTVGEFIGGYTMKGLGIRVKPVLTNETNQAVVRDTQKFVELSNCNHAKPFTYKSYDQVSSIPSSVFPAASTDFLKVEGLHFPGSFGVNANLKSCKPVQSLDESFWIFKEKFLSKTMIRKTAESTFKGIKVIEYKEDGDTFFQVNNVSIFKDGLVDLTNSSSLKVPLLMSAAHFSYGDTYLMTNFPNMVPNKERYTTTFKIEPVTGATIYLRQSFQINSYIQSSVVSAPRSRSLNITYMERSSSNIIASVIPLYWIEVEVEIASTNLESLQKIDAALKGSCASIVLGPMIGIALLLGSVFLFFKTKKRVLPEEDKE